MISIHAPLTGSDLLPTRRLCSIQNFNPRSPYGERQIPPTGIVDRMEFQSTLPLRGATYCINHVIQRLEFQSTLPLRGATIATLGPRTPFEISIHAPLTGSDLHRSVVRPVTRDFNPRSPYGERLLPKRQPVGSKLISIHAPLTGSDLKLAL